ncbi:zinc finger protein 54-like [Bradysia coprophila]|uniref:zinc finger protein 54-like n=1 Tax=Bradysia coprophila TaxID=38358 RepID=UPI00187DC366|nr:zinc finger protein 54-like [Bradysia coprophila]
MDLKEAVKGRSDAVDSSVLHASTHVGHMVKVKQEVDDEFDVTGHNFQEVTKTIKKEAEDDAAAEIEYTNDGPSPMLMYDSDPQSLDINDSYDQYEIVIKAEPQLDISDELENELIDQLDPSQKYSCSHCDFETELKYYLDIHNEVMHPQDKGCNPVDPSDLSCPHCDHEANSKLSLKRHITANHVVGEKRYACYICDFSTGNLLILQSHRACHRSDETYSCPRCKTFKSTQLAVMRAHDRKHLSKMSQQKLLFCGECDYRSFFKYSLKMHSKVHLIERPPEPIHSCTLCDFQTKRLRVLKVHHQRIHLHEEPFRCRICENTYSSNGSLSRHLKTHSKEEHFIKCTECDYKTLQYSSMKGHMRTHSKLPTRYTCDHCDFTTLRKTIMQTHMKMHRKAMTCSHCDFKTYVNSAFKKHRCPVGK